jgi:hypothetical protein
MEVYMSTVLGVLVCLSPLLFMAAGYYVGRYGFPIRLSVQRPRDRRAVQTVWADDDEEPIAA